MEKRFEQVDKRFEQVEKRFEQIDKRFEQVDAGHQFKTGQFNYSVKQAKDLRPSLGITRGAGL
jgi:hypothetical protein